MTRRLADFGRRPQLGIAVVGDHCAAGLAGRLAGE